MMMMRDGRIRRCVHALVVAALLVPALALATERSPEQPAGSPGIETPAATAAPDTLDRQLSERSAALSADSALDPATRDAALARLREAQQQLQAAVADRAETARLAAERSGAPAAIAALTAREPESATLVGREQWSNLSLAQLEIAASEAENLARSARQRVAETRQQVSDLKGHRTLYAAELAAARQALDDVSQQIMRISSASVGVAGTGSEELLARSRKQALEARLELLEEQRRGADVREQLLDARAISAVREVSAQDARVRLLREELARRRLSETVATSSRWMESPVGGYEAIAAIARSNHELAGEYAGPDAVFHRLDQVQRDLERLEQSSAEFENDTQELRARLAGLGRSFAAGILIAQGLEELPSAATHRTSLERRRIAINELQLHILVLARQLKRLERNLPGASAQVVARLPDLRSADRDEAIQVVSGLLEARLRVLQPLLHDLEQLLNGLAETQARETTLLADIREMDRFLRTREPWVRNGRRVTLADMPAAIAGLAALPSPLLWSGGSSAVRAAAGSRPKQAAWVLSIVLVAAAVLVALRQWRRRSAARHTSADDRTRPGLLLAMAALNGLAWAAITLALGKWLGGIPLAPLGVRTLGTVLVEISAGVFVVGMIAALYAREHGAGSINAALGPTGARVRVALRYLIGVIALLIASRLLMAAALDGAMPNAGTSARLCLLVGALLMFAGLRRAMGWRLPGRSRPRDGRRSFASLALYALALSIPVGFAVMLLQGFTVAAFDLTRALLASLQLLLIAGTVRVLFLSTAVDTTGQVSWFSLRHGRADLLHVLVTLSLIGVLVWVWRDVVEALRYLQDIPLWTTETIEGLKTVTVANLLACLTVLGGTLLAFWALPVIFSNESADASQRNVGSRYAVIALVRYVVLFVGLASAFSLLNIGWSKLQWMAAGLSVGLGFGLQETAANFFSGLTLLSERSVRVGDLVTVGDKTGVVTRIRVRATTLRDFDGREVVIPNKVLVTTQVTNWTLVDTKRRLQVVVGVDYGSDTALVEQKLLEAARGVAGVLPQPAPQAALEEFGVNALQYRLYAWIDDPAQALRINHDLHVRINQLLNECAIGIAYQQREVRVVPAGPFEVRLRDSQDGAPAPDHVRS